MPVLPEGEVEQDPEPSAKRCMWWFRARWSQASANASVWISGTMPFKATVEEDSQSSSVRTA